MLLAKEIDFLKLLEGIRTNFLNKLFEMITILGEETLIILIVAIIYYCFSKKEAKRLFFIVVTSTAVNTIAKNLVRRPRPFANGEVTAIRQETATGYSFPSGHTQNIATLGTYFSERIRKIWFIIVASIVVLLVGFSRMYLGVHFPSDVIVGLILGVGVTIGFGILYDKSKNQNLLMLIMLLVLVPFFIAFMFTKDENALSLAANFYKMFGMFSGLLVGSIFEENIVKYDIEGPIWKKILRVVIAIGLVFAVKEGFKLLYKGSGIHVKLIMDSIRYFLMLFVGLGICPLLYKKIKL